jgi:hypothetical protein
MQALSEMLNLVSYCSCKQDLLTHLGSSIRRDQKKHYLSDIVGAGEKLLELVRSNYKNLAANVMSLLNSSNSDYLLQILAMNALAIQYQSSECDLAAKILPILQPMISGDVKYWKVTDRPLNTPSIQSRNSKTLVAGCVSIGRELLSPIQHTYFQQTLEFAISLWIYPLQDKSEMRGNSWRTIIFKGTDEESCKTRTPALFFCTDDCSLALCVSTTTNWNVCLRGTTEIMLEAWTHVTCTCSLQVF